MEYIYEEVKAGLKSSIARVKFIKADGTVREMVCTLMPEFLPEHEEGKRTKAVNEEVVSVWDMKKNAWRSFRLDSIESLEWLCGGTIEETS